MITPSRCTIYHKAPQYYPFGNTRSQNVLQNFNINEKTSNLVEVLFLGCGDLRNTLEATATRGISKFNFHLLDHNPMILARNVIALKIIEADDFDPANPTDFNFLWDVWYNLDWPEKTRQKFVKVLQNLLDESIPKNVVLTNNFDLEILKIFWTSWSSTASKNPIESEKLMKKLQKDRPRYIVAALEENYTEIVHRAGSLQEAYSNVLDSYSADWEKNVGARALQDRVRKMIRQEARQFLKTGSCRTETENCVCVNPTFLHPTTYRMIVESSFPFDGYIPLSQGEEMDTSDGDKILIRFCQAKLKSLISSYRHRIKDVQIFLHLEDAFEFCYRDSTGKFDVVDSSNIADHTGLPNLINACILKLSDSPDAILLTQSMFWAAKTASIKQYVEKELCCSLSMIPTIYGLRLLDRVELGTDDPDALRRLASNTRTLNWKKVPKFRNICLSPSPAVIRCLEQLAYRSFSSVGPLKDIDGVEEFKWAHITPQTFHFTADSFLQRVEADRRCMDHLKFPSSFNLNRRTMESWKNNETVFKFSLDQLNTALETEYLEYFKFVYFITEKTGCRMLRLILAPSSGHVMKCLQKTVGRLLNFPIDFQGMISSPDVHYIDNFQLQVNLESDGDIEGAKVSFLLHRDHGLLLKPYLGIIIDLDTGIPILLFESIKDAKIEEYLSPHPFRLPAESTSKPNTQREETQMRVESCIETETQYTLIISTQIGNFDGLNVSAIQTKPCESCHDVIVSLCQSTGVEPLELSFPHPVLAGKILVTCKDRMVNLVLKKAIYEPWPYDFQSNNLRWNVDSLTPWKDGSGFDPLDDHICKQQIPHSMISELACLPRVRMIISEIFMVSNAVDSDLFVVMQPEKSLNPEKNYDLLIRVHRPILTSTLGGPLLILSVLDSRQSENRLTKEVIDRIFVHGANSENSLSITGTAEELKLFRFVLRLNSTKIKPSTWQKKNLPHGGNNQLLSTFITPLYLDIPMCPDEFDQMYEKYGFSMGTVTRDGVKIDDDSKCIGCKKSSPKLKRCSSCRLVIYCSVECQRAHWPIHKTPCSKVLKDGSR